MTQRPVQRQRNWAVYILTALAVIAGLLALIDAARYMGWLPVATLGPLKFFVPNAQGLAALLAVVVAVIWFVVARWLWSLNPSGWLFVVVIAIINLIFLLLAILGKTTFGAVALAVAVNVIALILALLPGTKLAFGQNGAQGPRPGDQAAVAPPLATRGTAIPDSTGALRSAGTSATAAAAGAATDAGAAVSGAGAAVAGAAVAGAAGAAALAGGAKDQAVESASRASAEVGAAADAGGQAVEGAAETAAAGVSRVAETAGDLAGEAGAAVAAAPGVVAGAAGAVVEGAGNLAESTVEQVVKEIDATFSLEEIAKFKEKLEFVKGIGPVYAEKLRSAGVETVLDLLRHGATRKGRTELVEKTGIAGKLILEWVNHADLYRIKGVGSEYADLLEAAGVDTVVELAKRNPAKLLYAVLETNKVKQLVAKEPAALQVEDWVAQAKMLPRVIEY